MIRYRYIKVPTNRHNKILWNILAFIGFMIQAKLKDFLWLSYDNNLQVWIRYDLKCYTFVIRYCYIKVPTNRRNKILWNILACIGFMIQAKLKDFLWLSYDSTRHLRIRYDLKCYTFMIRYRYIKVPTKKHNKFLWNTLVIKGQALSWYNRPICFEWYKLNTEDYFTEHHLKR